MALKVKKNRADKLINLLHTVSEQENAAFLSAIKQFSKCNEKQKNLLIETLNWMITEFGVPTFIKYSANKQEHVKGVEHFSLHCERVRFKLGPLYSDIQADICLARSTTPGCSSRDPLLKLKFNSGERRLLVVSGAEQVVAFINGSRNGGGLYEEDEVAPATSPRRSVPSTVMTFNERNILLPNVRCYLNKKKFSFIIEDEQPHGRFDLYINHPERVLVELKYINPNENVLEKIRYAIGQILIYAFDPRRTREIERKWVIINECEVCESVKKALNEIQKITSVEFYQLRGSHLLQIDAW